VVYVFIAAAIAEDMAVNGCTTEVITTNEVVTSDYAVKFRAIFLE
jgi:hypothetical protein